MIWAIRSERVVNGHNVEVILTESGSGRIWAIKLVRGQSRYDRSPHCSGK